MKYYTDTLDLALLYVLFVIPQLSLQYIMYNVASVLLHSTLPCAVATTHNGWWKYCLVSQDLKQLPNVDIGNYVLKVDKLEEPQ